jgi:hypothetical protein
VCNTQYGSKNVYAIRLAATGIGELAYLVTV